jgi:hypothetical protein
MSFRQDVWKVPQHNSSSYVNDSRRRNDATESREWEIVRIVVPVTGGTTDDGFVVIRNIPAELY